LRNWSLRKTVALVGTLNLLYFFIEYYFAKKFNSVSLLSDSVDFLEDASVNALIFLAFLWGARARARLSYVLALFLLIPAGTFLWNAIAQLVERVTPNGNGMSVVGSGALLVNVFCSFLLTRFKNAEGGLAKAAFYSARNDAIANVLIIAAGFITLWWISTVPDLIVGAAIFLMNADSAKDIIEAARKEHRENL
jgi:Co/Zn/Cd efflux system component